MAVSTQRLRGEGSPPAKRDPSAAHEGERHVQPDVDRLRQSLVARLDDLERRIGGGGAPVETGGSIEQFLSDVTREARDAGSRLLRLLEGPRGVAARVVGALASPSTDAAGVDPRLRDALADALKPVARGWLGLRVRTEIPLPQRGGVLVALNRSGWPLPTEAVVVAGAIAERARRRDVYVLWDVAVAGAFAVGAALRRVGVLPAEPDAARRLLARGALVVAFPEGGAAREKSYAARHRLAPFRDAFLVEEARAAGAAVVPGAVLGPAESHPVLGRIAGLPLTPTFPLAGALGLVPLPLGWRVRIGVPMLYEEHGATPEDTAVVLRNRMQAMLADMVSERRSIVRG